MKLRRATLGLVLSLALPSVALAEEAPATVDPAAPVASDPVAANDAPPVAAETAAPVATAEPSAVAARDVPDASVDARPWLRAARTERVTREESSSGGVRALLATMLVVGLGGAAWRLRKRGATTPAARAARLSPEVIGSTRVGPKAFAVVTEIAGRRALLGVTDSSVSLLGWLDAAPVADAAPLAEVPAPASVPAPAPRPASTAVELLADRRAADPTLFERLVAESIERGDTVHTTLPAPPRASEPQLIDVEGQAAGLLARLGGRRS